MLVFIDDSGDAGFKVERGSSSVFIICCVIFDDELEAERAAVRIKELRRELKKRDEFEFKFNKCSRDYRLKFLAAVAPYQFQVRAIVMKKTAIYSEELKTSKQSFYNFTVKTVLTHSRSHIRQAKIRLDGHADKRFRRELARYLVSTLNDRNNQLIHDLRFRDSKKDVLVQLADMVAGAIHRTYQTEKQDTRLYVKPIKRHLQDIWEFN